MKCWKIHRLIGWAVALQGLAGSPTASAQGTIVYVNPPDHQMMSPGGRTLLHTVDLDANGQPDFTFYVHGSFRIHSTTGGRSIAVPKGGGDLGSFSIPLSEGEPITPSLQPGLFWLSSDFISPDLWIGQTLHFADTSGTHGFWQPNLTAFVGVEFAIDGGTHYGWIRVSTPFLAGVNGGIIHDWAYNTIPGQPILAGQVPEPGTVTLLVFGAGVIWWRLSRRR